MTTNLTAQEHILIYTDGSCSGNPGPGGYAAVARRIDSDGNVLETAKVLGSEPHHTTNVRMEMMAVAIALEQATIDDALPIIVRSDNQMISKGMNDWVRNWIKKGWRKADGKPVLNQDLWERIIAASAGKAVEFDWVKGHAGDPYNEEVDTLAVEQTQKGITKRHRV